MKQDIMPRQTAASLVDSHDRVQELVHEGIGKLAEARRIMQAMCSTYRSNLFGSPLHHNLTNFDLEKDSRTLEHVATEVRENYWQTAMTMVGLRATMGAKERAAFDKQFENHDLPAFDLDTIYATIEGAISGHPERVENLIREVFDWLRPRPHSGGHKTNKRGKVGKRVILSHMMSPSLRGLSWSTYFNPRDQIHDLDKVFHLLDGKGLPKSPDDAITAINGACQQGQASTETMYFRFKWFRNNNLHVEFLRPDLLAELNRIGAGGRWEVAA